MTHSVILGCIHWTLKLIQRRPFSICTSWCSSGLKTSVSSCWWTSSARPSRARIHISQLGVVLNLHGDLYSPWYVCTYQWLISGAVHKASHPAPVKFDLQAGVTAPSEPSQTGWSHAKKGMSSSFFRCPSVNIEEGRKRRPTSSPNLWQLPVTALEVKMHNICFAYLLKLNVAPTCYNVK